MKSLTLKMERLITKVFKTPGWKKYYLCIKMEGYRNPYHLHDDIHWKFTIKEYSSGHCISREVGGLLEKHHPQNVTEMIWHPPFSSVFLPIHNVIQFHSNCIWSFSVGQRKFNWQLIDIGEGDTNRFVQKWHVCASKSYILETICLILKLKSFAYVAH